MRVAEGHDLFSGGSWKEQAAWAEIGLLRDTANSFSLVLHVF
jgi:hypothetical protein